jgi:hypothetical protein
MPADGNLPLEADQAEDRFEQGRLARAVRPPQRQDFAGNGREGNFV